MPRTRSCPSRRRAPRRDGAPRSARARCRERACRRFRRSRCRCPSRGRDRGWLHSVTGKGGFGVSVGSRDRRPSSMPASHPDRRRSLRRREHAPAATSAATKQKTTPRRIHMRPRAEVIIMTSSHERTTSADPSLASKARSTCRTRCRRAAQRERQARRRVPASAASRPPTARADVDELLGRLLARATQAEVHAQHLEQTLARLNEERVVLEARMADLVRQLDDADTHRASLEAQGKTVSRSRRTDGPVTLAYVRSMATELVRALDRVGSRIEPNPSLPTPRPPSDFPTPRSRSDRPRRCPNRA